MDMCCACAALVCRKITELEEELRIVGNNMKSLEISEQEVRVRLPATPCPFACLVCEQSVHIAHSSKHIAEPVTPRAA